MYTSPFGSKALPLPCRSPFSFLSPSYTCDRSRTMTTAFASTLRLIENRRALKLRAIRFSIDGGRYIYRDIAIISFMIDFSIFCYIDSDNFILFYPEWINFRLSTLVQLVHRPRIFHFVFCHSQLSAEISISLRSSANRSYTPPTVLLCKRCTFWKNNIMCLKHFWRRMKSKTRRMRNYIFIDVHLYELIRSEAKRRLLVFALSLFPVSSSKNTIVRTIVSLNFESLLND